jgi:RNA polymerase sigma factor (sigma-70 family)
MTNLHISAWRRRRINEYPSEELPERPDGSDSMGDTELRAVLWRALAKLPEPQRTMLVLRYYEGRTDPEVAEVLGCSVGTVKSSIWRALRRLREDDALSFGADEAFAELVA